MTAAAIAPPVGSPPPLTLLTKVLYASGSVANVIKQRGLSTFLLIFYNQVIGLPPQMVATAIMIALIFDAFVDPTVGQVSDNFRSRLGRRHPFMYAAALPVSLAFFAIWNPPAGWPTEAIFAYMLFFLLTVRLFDTFFELPSSALLAELTRNYDERTSIIALRSLCGVVGGAAMTYLAYDVLLKENADGSGGVLAREGYFGYSIVAALVIFSFILISSAGTHRRIPYLSAPPARKITVGAMAREVAATLNNRSFVVLTISGMFMSISLGIKDALELYFSLYFWELKQSQLAVMTIAAIIASVIGASLASKVAKALGKKKAAITMFAGAVVALVAPIVLRLLHLMPPNGSDLLFAILFVDVVLNGAMAVMTGVMLSSMMADVVEDSQVKTGRRSEGLLMSADNLFKKIVSGVGVFVSGVVLSLVAFPEKAQRGAVDPEVLRNLALVYVPVICSFYAVAILCLFLYRIDKKIHEDNLAKLAAMDDAAERKGAGESAPSLP
ncbi:MAG: MFS transporter [Caulobacteraceae bacterium]|nr:MFS transporter [Caulobacteraceae bacterium]